MLSIPWGGGGVLYYDYQSDAHATEPLRELYALLFIIFVLCVLSIIVCLLALLVSLVGYILGLCVCAVHCTLFTCPLGVTSRLYSRTEVLPRDLLYYSGYIFVQ